MSDHSAVFSVSPSAYSPSFFAAGNIPLATYNAETEVVTFDWPQIEAQAESGGLNRGMARILLAARDAGREQDS